jgi:hypothetical protein
MAIHSPHSRPRPQFDSSADRKRRQRWHILRDQTLRLWTGIIGLSGLALEWRGARSPGLLVLHLVVLSGITLTYRELYLQRRAIRLRLPEQTYHDPWSRPNPGSDEPPPPDDPF